MAVTIPTRARSRVSRVFRATLSTFLLVLTGLSQTSAFALASTPVTAGYRDFDFGAVVSSTPTGEKPQSKLWFADGIWWAIMWDPALSSNAIHRLNLATQNWSSTGVLIDNRVGSKADALWDGSRLYIASNVFTLSPAATTSGNAGRLYRYAYNAGTDTYTLDSGFPVTVNGSKAEALVLDKDSTGKLWVTWVEGGKVKINRSTTDDLTWGTPFDLPVQGANVDPDDISSVVKFGGTKIGVMWSNQVDKRMYFAVHLDGTSDTSWQPRESALGDGVALWADDHINMHASCTADGSLYAVVKTGMTGANPLNVMVKRTSAGVWSNSTVGTGSDNHSRAVMVIDSDANRAYVFAPDISGSVPFIIYMKSCSLSDIQFPGGAGTPFINSPQDILENNPTTTKQCVNGASGIVVLASDQDTHFYVHNFLDLSGTAPTISSFTPTSGIAGTQVTITGARFTGATSVQFNLTQTVPFTIVNSTTILANVPAGSSSGPIRVTTPAGTGTSASSFNVIIPPTLTSFTPTTGPVGELVTIFGTGFTTASAVKFNNTSSTFSVTSDTSLTSPVPVGATTGLLIVTSSTGSDTSATSFQVIQPPTIASFNPASGPGGSEVTVLGTNFATASAVKFNGISSTFAVDSASRLRAIVPAGFTSGTISVTNPAGTGTSATSFTVSGPVITGFSPVTGMTGTQIQIDGSGFLGTTSVAFNGALAGFVIDSNIRIRAIVPNSATTGKISVTNPNGTALSTNNFVPVLPPAITFFFPDKGAIGSNVAIHGHDFFGVTLVTFDGLAATTYTVNSDTMITAQVPTGATTGRIGITASGGATQSATNFLVLGPPPTQTFNVAHDAQVNSGSTSTNYGSLNELRVRANSSPNYNSYLKFGLVGVGTSIRKATLRLYSFDGGPDGGSVYLVSNNLFGTSTPWTESVLTYANAPTIGATAVAPFQIVANNTFVDYDVTSAIAGDGTYSFALKSANSNSVYYVSKEGTTVAQRPVLIVESNVAPQIGSFTPASGQVAASVTVMGTGFTGATSVKFNGTSSTYTVNSDTVITASVPAGASSGPIGVANSVGSATSATSFTVILPPSISSFTPASGPVGTEVTVHGVGFFTANTFRFGGTPTFFTVDNDTTLRSIVPGGASSGALTVINTLGTANSAASFTVINPPTVTSFSPGNGQVGAEITIRGRNYGTAYAVTFNGTIATFTVDNDSTLRANVPSGASSGAVTVTNPAGTGTSTTNFTVLSLPTIASFTPVQGPVGTAVTLVGAHFTGATAVRFNGTIASFTVVNDTSLTTTVPPGSTTGLISVTNPVGTANSTASFTVILPPTISYFTPSTGPVGIEVTVHGTRFATASAVKFNALAATFTVETDTTLRATVPAGFSTGAVSVTNPAGTATSAASFTVIFAPTLSSFTPGNGGVGLVVEIAGTGFNAATAFRFNGTSAAFSVDSDVLAHATVPAGATSGLISVTNPAGSASSAASFTVNPAPTITTFTPGSGPAGIQVTVTGTGFTSTSAVSFNGTAATFTVDNNTQLRATVPAGATTGVISVTTPGGSVASAASFTVIQTPTVSSFSPTSGPAGAQVTVLGTSFATASAVLFNGTTAVFVIDNDGQLRATVPAGATSGTVSVTNPSGTGTSAGSFTVITTPAITFFTPATGPVGTEVTVHGVRFTSASAVRFNGTIATYTVDTDTTLRATVPAGATTGTISVQNPAGTATSAASFSVIPSPVVTFFSPTSGPVGTEVTVHGASFSTASVVRFNGTVATYTVDTDTTLRATVPVGAASGTISVQNPAGTATSAASFSVILSPTVGSFNPTSGPVGAEITVQGTSFSTASAVRFNGTTATFTVDNATQLRATVPAGATSGTISVTNPAGTGTSAGSFTLIQAPTVSSFTPTSGAVGLEVTVQGTNFSITSAVRFNGTTATFTVDNATQLRATVPAGATSGTISVTNPAGTANSVGSFSVIAVPTLASFNPASGPVGTQVTLHGASFTTASSVKFNGTTAVYTVDNDSTLRGTVPAGANTGTISVTNPAGTGTSATSFTVLKPPSVVTFNPTSGPVGLEVTLQGSGFSGTTAVRFNGTVSTFIVDSDVQVRATVPAGATTGPLSVSNPIGTFTTGANFTVLPPPTVTSFTPTSGPVGVQVTLQGTRFTGATSVRFNGLSATTFTVDTDTQLRATVPVGATSGTISVTGPTGIGTSSTSFTVVNPPNVATFTPTSGPVGLEVTVTGTGFATASAVRFNGTTSVFTVDSDTALRATVPVGATTGPISVTNPSGTFASAASFTVITTPTVTTFNPAAGPVGLEITITGTGFATASAVRFNGTTATFVIDNGTQLRAVVPAGATSGTISVTNPAGTGTSAASFSVIPAPTVTSFNPGNGPSGAQITLTGTSFSTASAVRFNGTTSTFIVDNNTQIRATVPVGATSGPISVTNVAGTGASSTNFLVVFPPTINSFNPSTGGPGLQVTILGSGFATATAVRFNGMIASFTAIDDGELRATVPVGATTGPVSVSNPAGTFATGADFTIVPAPAVSGLSPTSGAVGALITVTGTNFSGATAVRFNGTSASYTIDNSTQIRATVPAGATSGSVSVTTPSGTGSSATSFTVIATPTISSFAPGVGAVGTQVTIRGTSFAFATAVRFNGTSATFTIDSDTTVRATVPVTTSGPISVTNAAGTATSVASFTVMSPPAISSFNPTSGTVGTSVTVQGSGFTSATAVRFNGTTSVFVVDSDVQLHATVPAGATTGPISVSNPAGTFTSGPDFTVIPSPVITSFNPASAAVGVQITIQGTGFTGATSVRFNGTAATFILDSDIQVRATVPASATNGPISVTTPGGGTGTSSTNFVVIRPPTVSTFTPTSGAVGVEVTVSGTNFTTTTLVKFNTTNATFIVDSDVQLRATVPAGATTGPISVGNTLGTFTTGANFTVIPAPIVASFNPSSGPVGIEVTFHGTGFSTASAVRFNGTTATFTTDNDSTLRATVPAGATSGTVSVTNPSGTGTSAASFTVILPPTVTFFTPTSGPVGSQVTVHGTRFSTVSAVQLNGSSATFSGLSDTTLLATVPVGATSGTIGVTNPAGSATSAASFTVIAPPTVSSFTPASGAVGIEVTVQGTGFSTASAVRFNGTIASFSIDNATQLRATVPAGATSGPISVTNPAGTAASVGSFSVVVSGAPTISSFTPSSGPVGATITLHGTHFTGAFAVWFNGVRSFTFGIDNDSTMNVAVPAGATTGPVTLQNAAGTGASTANFIVIDPPTITSFSPTIGIVGTEVTVHGTNFSTALQVHFNGSIATFTVDNDSTLRAIVTSPATTGPVSVVNPGGTFHSVNNFTVTTSAFGPPVIQSFSPLSGPATTIVTIEGSGFTRVGEVRFNGVATTFMVISDALLRANVPNGATSGLITLTNPVDSDTSATSFTVTAGIVGVEGSGTPRAFALGRNFPNPFTARTRITFELPRAVKVRLTVYDLGGRAVRTLVDGDQPAGVHEVSWDARDRVGSLVSTGVYLLKLEAEGFTSTRRVLRVR